MSDDLRAKLTDEFLTALVEVARTIGWNAGDYHETISFVQEVFSAAGRQVPDADSLKPYDKVS